MRADAEIDAMSRKMKKAVREAIKSFTRSAAWADRVRVTNTIALATAEALHEEFGLDVMICGVEGAVAKIRTREESAAQKRRLAAVEDEA